MSSKKPCISGVMMDEAEECSGSYMRIWSVSLVIYEVTRDLAKFTELCEGM